MIPFADVNIVAVVVATIANMVLGFIWYAPAVFGKTWMKAAKVHEQQDKSGMSASVVQCLIATFIASYVLALLLAYTRIQSMQDGLVFGALLWLAASAPVLISEFIWEHRPIELFFIGGAYWLVSIVVTITLLLKFS